MARMHTTPASSAAAVVDAETPVRMAAQRLRNTLRLNAGTSLLGGLTATIAAGPIDRLLGTHSAGWVRTTGVGLTLFAIGVIAIGGARIRRLARFTPRVSAADATWVAASIVTIAVGWYSATGAFVVGAVALMVAAFAIRQVVLLRRLAAETTGSHAAVLDETPPTEVFHVEVTSSATPEIAWSVITDHDLYGRLAPNLSRVTPITPDGPGLARTCANRSGGEWHETCTLWDEGHQYDIAVETTDYPYPLTEMRGSWWTTADTPATIGMDFRYRPQPGVRGRLFAIAMQAALPVVLRRILRGWRHEAAERQRR